MFWINFLRKHTMSHIRDNVQQPTCFLLRCSVMREICKNFTFRSWNVFSLAFQVCPVHIITRPQWSVPWHKTFWHVSAVRVCYHFEGIASCYVPDDVGHRHWEYMCNSTLSPWDDRHWRWRSLWYFRPRSQMHGCRGLVRLVILRYRLRIWLRIQEHCMKHEASQN